MIIAIDGPGGAGKSTVAKAVAKTLGFSCLDTGAMYRAIAWWAVHSGIDLHDDAALGEIACTKEIGFGHEAGDPIPKQVFIEGIEVTEAIRTEAIDKAVSPVSAAPSVREALVVQQQRIGSEGDYVVEGRDIGTVVFPTAEVKVFLTASDEERAHRRVRQNVDKNNGSFNFEEVLADLRRRDEYDSTRATSPLKPADDAIIMDTTSLFIEDVIGKICDLARAASSAVSAHLPGSAAVPIPEA